ncbi:Ger(x)C family spore germination protein [Niallia taxi]|uniref:Ger(x)C family spore germination protein n=1 Tax=Niallia taxi TaxID=2499688 RepID=UPI00317F769F
MKKRLFILIGLILVITGCSNKKEIQYQAYAVGLGIDFKDDEFTVTLQFLDFANVAKTEQPNSTQPAPIWLGIGKGKTIEEAITQIYQGLQIQANFDQLNIIIFSKDALKYKLDESLSALMTNFNIRMTGWVYGTEENIEDIFTAKVPFYYPYTASNLNKPLESHQQSSTIPPFTLEKLVYDNNEPTRTVILPNIIVKKKFIKKDQEPFVVTVIDGAWNIKDKKFKGLLHEKDIIGFVRMNNQAVRTLMTLNEGQNIPLSLEIDSPKVMRNAEIKNGQLECQLKITFSVTLREGAVGRNISKTKKSIEEKVKDEIMTAFENAKKEDVDLYQFEDYLYRYNFEEWKTFKKEKLPLSLSKNHISINISPLESIGKLRSEIN